MTDPERLDREVGVTDYGRPGPDGKSQNQRTLEEMRADPARRDEFLDTEADRVANAGATPAATKRIRDQLADVIVNVNVNGSPGTNVYVQVNTTPKQVNQAAQVIAADAQTPGFNQRKKRRILRAFEAVAGAIVAAVDVPLFPSPVVCQPCR